MLLGKIPHFEQLIATIRSREISASIVVQTKSQLKAIYKEHAETIIGNCDTEVFLGGKEPGTLKDLVFALGRDNVDDMNTSESRGQSPSKSRSYTKLGRDLMGVSELSAMSRKKCVVLISGVAPFCSSKYDITSHPMYSLAAERKEDKTWFDTRRYLRAKRARAYSLDGLKKRLAPGVKVHKETVIDLSEEPTEKT
jgi:type IV secretion system protein VirD4